MGGRKKYHKQLSAKQAMKNDWLDWRFWRNLTIYFFVFSLAGHWMEMVVTGFIGLLTGNLPTHGIFDNWSEFYWVYGFGAVVCILLLYPLNTYIGRQRILINYFINTLAVAIIEYVAGWVIILRFGSNYCWDYSEKLFNLQGQICLQNTLFFGLVATIFTLSIYPRLNAIFLHRK